MPASAARAALQPTSRFALRRVAIRNASTTSEAANAASSKAKEGASAAASKASEGLSRVQAASSGVIAKAGPALQGVQNSLGNVGGRTGRLIQAVSSLIPPTIYYSKVALELGKIVAKGQKISAPNVQQFQNAFQPIANAARNPSQLSQHIPHLSSPQQYLNQVRNMSSQQLVTVGVIFAEVLGFFTVGEMLGRFKIVGYRGAPAHESH
ncbi:hypothetical protein FH972_022172 [Carpinus fangiana]|uniref:Uncharacterized protein n=1 Tax=Carpinus fangiana TaxID=176857 RepID=A0A5N6KRU0_9ROSI|nr:hypothetical protein FH972_022172 [Carpinus fangiana]